MEDIRDQRKKLTQVIEEELTPAEQEVLKIAATLLNHVVRGAEARFGEPNRRRRAAS